MIRAFLKFYFSPSLKSWRALRRTCIKRLPKKEKANASASA